MTGMLAMSAMLAASSQAVSLDRMPANRLDCETTSHFAGENARLSAASYAFVFPFARAGRGAWPKMRWIMTQDDGRSWIDEGTILSRQGTAWPDFAAEVALDRTGSRYSFRSDPSVRGRIAISGSHITDHAGTIEEAGICRIVPDLHGNEGRPQ